MDPAVAALQSPWPRGLPIQCLMGSVSVAVDSAFNQTPFMADRAAEVVMADPAVALLDVTNDKETKRAVGQFVDSFDIALAIYVMQCPPGHERARRVDAAWCHAIHKLSLGPSTTQSDGSKMVVNGRLSEYEADLFWRIIFERATPSVKIPDSKIKINKEYPAIPTDVGPREPFEWNPAAMVIPAVESRELPATVLDCMIAAPQLLHWLARRDFPVPRVKTQAVESTPLWSYKKLEDLRKLPRPLQEGIIATALLVESSNIEGSKIFALPFPSDSNVRYPSLFLDHDFLLSTDTLYPTADFALFYMTKILPSTLLLDLSTSALKALSRTPSDSTKLASTEHIAYRLLRVLSKSDRPQLASDLIVRTILDHPNASSWHRQLLTKSLVRNLFAEQAQHMITLFASSILESLERQVNSSSSQEKAKGSDTSSGSYIKVTTVKFLAQFLDDADFVPPGFCVDTLSKLFQKALHVDIRVAVLESMLSRLDRCRDESSNVLAEKVMSALEEAIPVLGSLNERQQTRESDWVEAEKTGKLPEVYDDGGMQTLPPMLNVVLRATTGSTIRSDSQRADFIRRIVLPVVETSEASSARWVKLFTLKHLSADQSIPTPSFPTRPSILEYVINVCPTRIPKHILDQYQQFLLTNISPPVDLVQLNEKVKSDVKLSDSNEGKFWLSLYGRGADVTTGAIASMLTERWQMSVILDGIQIPHVQELVFEQAETLLQLADASFTHWNKFIAALEPPHIRHRSIGDGKAWIANAKPVLLRIIDRIDALRTPAWQRDRNRQPTVLPATSRLRLWLLHYPQLAHSADPCAMFANQIISLLQESLDQGLAHHTRLGEIESALSKCLPDDGIRVACCLGDVKWGASTKVPEILLRVELADKQLRKAALPRDKDDEVVREVKAMLDIWRECEVEEVRMRGIGLGKHLKL